MRVDTMVLLRRLDEALSKMGTNEPPYATITMALSKTELMTLISALDVLGAIRDAVEK